MSSGGVPTALGTARARFMEGLPGRSRELRAAIALVAASPDDPRPREELRRRLHALYASAQVFQLDALAAMVTAGIIRLDAARDEGRAVEDADLDVLVELVGRLSGYSATGSRGPSLVGRRGEASIPPPGARPTRSTPAYGTPVSGAVRTPASQPPAEPQKKEGSGTIPRMPTVDSKGRVRDGSGTLPNMPVAIAETVPGEIQAPALCVLVIDAEEIQAEVRAALSVERFEVSGATDTEEALKILRNVSPDVVLVDRELAAQSGDLVRRLYDDPLTDVRAVFLLQAADRSGTTRGLSLLGADRAIDKPLDANVLNHALSAVMFARRARHSPLEGLIEATAEDIAARVAEEIRTGLTDSLQIGRNEKIPVGDGAELRAAAWGAIGRIRAHLAHQAAGRVRFRDAAFQGEPAMLALGEQEPEGSQAELVKSIAGRRVLVADDDPAVLWFFGGLLREAGAQVLEARDGKEALEIARMRRPQVVISDILMPKIDGFALCRELARDLMLADVPVVLLSWKEDFLQRMRELEAGAKGYLRKEAGSEAVLACVGEVLRPRVRLEAQLDAGGEVRGRLEGLGVLALLEIVAVRWGNGRLNIRDTMNLFEVEIRNGNTLAVTRTATDGSFQRGEGALTQLLGVRTGRFTVVAADGPVRGTMDQPLDQLLSSCSRRLGALLDAVSDTRLMHVARVAFDDEVLSALLTATPTPVASVVEHLRGGSTVRDLVNRGVFPPDEIEANLRELARHGAIERVFDEQGLDLVEAALLDRDQRPGSLMHSSHPARPVSEPPIELNEDDVAFEESAAVPPDRLPSDVIDADDAVEEIVEQAVEPVRAEPSIIVDARLRVAPPVPRSVPAPSLPEARPRQRAPSREREEDRGGLGFVLTVATLFALSYYAYLNFYPEESLPTPVSIAPGPVTAPPAEPPPSAAPAAEAEAPDGPEVGRALPFIDRSRGVDVAEDQGLLVVEFDGDGPAPTVRVGSEDLGSAPVAAALDPGRHELMIGRGEESSFQYVEIRSGETRIVEIR